MAAEVTAHDGAFTVGAVRRLFEARFRTENYLGYGPGRVFEVSPDGTRFLIDVVGSDQSPPIVPITVITNWTSALTKP